MHGEFLNFSVMSWTKPLKLRPDAASDTSRRNNRRVAMQRKLRPDAFSATSCLYQVTLLHCYIKHLGDLEYLKQKHLGDLEHFNKKHLGDLELICNFAFKISKL